MQLNFTSRLTQALLGIMVSSCSGDRVLMATKTNVGLDIDTKPPTAELTIARRELAIQPTFPEMMGNNIVDSTDSKKIVTKGITETEINTKSTDSKENALPLLGSFGLQGNFLNPRITGQFAGGDAALYLTQGSNNPVDSSLCLKNPPEDPRGWLLKAWHFLTGTTLGKYQKEARLFYFATDTAYGLKVAWSGTSGPYPDSLKLGYNRKEYASAPIFVDYGCSGGQAGWNIKLPSFYASIDNSSGLDKEANASDNSSELEKEVDSVSNIWKSSPKHIQFIATGKAASAFAKRESVRQIVFENMAPDAAKIEAAALNKDLIEEIETIFNKADEKTKSEIVASAFDLKLVSSTDKDKFLNALYTYTREVNYPISFKLNKLRYVANSY
jgi:hypothetical protein